MICLMMKHAQKVDPIMYVNEINRQIYTKKTVIIFHNMKDMIVLELCYN